MAGMAALRGVVRPDSTPYSWSQAAQLVRELSSSGLLLMSNGFPTPPPIGTDEDASAPGIPQPVHVPGGVQLPPSLPPGDNEFESEGWGWLPPPLITEGGNVPFPTPVVPPGTGVSPPYIQFENGNEHILPVDYWFPRYSEPGPNPPVVFANIMMIGPTPPPMTPGTNPVKMSTVPTIPQMPWVPFPPPAPVCITPPTITVVNPPPTQGGQLACPQGSWSGSPTITRQWYNDNGAIAGATALAYTMTAADVGLSIYCILTGTNMGGVGTGQSNAVGPVNPPAEEARSAPEPDDDGDDEPPHRRTTKPKKKGR